MQRKAMLAAKVFNKYYTARHTTTTMRTDSLSGRHGERTTSISCMTRQAVYTLSSTTGPSITS